MPALGGSTPYNAGVVRESQRVEIMPSFPAELNSARFAWFEMKAIQRLKIGCAAVSEVRSKPLTRFEIKRNLGAQIELLGVCNLIVAEGTDLISNLLLWMPLGLQGISEPLDM